MKDSGHRFMKLYEPQQDKSRPKKPIPGYITVKLQNVKDNNGRKIESSRRRERTNMRWTDSIKEAIG